MQSFRVIKPTRELAPYVKSYWILEDDSIIPVTERLLPVGSIQITFHKGKQLFSKTRNELHPQSLICGHNIGFSDIVSTGNIEIITIVFQPHAARTFFNLPLNVFRGYHISIHDIDDSELSDLAKRIEDTPDNEMCIRYIETFLLYRLRRYSSYHQGRISTVIREINAQPQTTVPKLSDLACLSTKQFNRIFVDHVGTNPKEFMRIVRMQRALYSLQIQPGIEFAQVAYACGFTDQSHLIKEFKLFSGYTPTEFLAACPPYSDYFSAI